MKIKKMSFLRITLGVILSLLLCFSFVSAKGGGGDKPPKTKPPQVVKVTPKKGAQGATIDIVIKGKNFVENATVSLGEGITVNGVTFVSATELGANISIASDAAKGPRPVQVTNPDSKKSQAKKIFKVVTTSTTTTTVTETSTSTTTETTTTT